MKIEVCPSNRKKVKIVFPISLLAFILRFGPRIAIKHMSKEINKGPDLKEVDFKLLGRAFYQLKRYKGLKLVEVQSRDGTRVTVQI